MQWILEHSGGLAAIWAGGLVWMLAYGRTLGLGSAALVSTALGGLLVALIAALFGLGLGPDPAVQWLAVAAVIFAARPTTTQRDRPSLSLSLLPMVLVAWQGLGAVTAAVIVAGTGALDADRPRRWLLLGSMVAFALAALVDDNSLRLWAELRRWAGLGLDQASTAVHLIEQGSRAIGWGALLSWMVRRRR